MASKQSDSSFVRFPLHRCHRRWKNLQRLSLLWVVVVVVFAADQYLLLLPMVAHNYSAFYLFHYPYISCSLLFITGFCALSIWIRPRYLIVAKNQGVIHYSLPIIGQRTYYFVEVSAIQLEIDMSQMLLKLKSPKLYRIYLKLHSGKLLLISEATIEEAINEVCEKLQAIFEITEVEHLSRVGRKRGDEIALGNYTIEKELSHGGMGKVLLAKDKRDNKQVALKVLPACFALQDNYVTSFARETNILQKLSHPNIVKIYDLGRDTDNKQDVYFYAMEFIEGRPLSDWTDERKLTCTQSAKYTIEIALALNYIHKHGVVHRDIKPHNVMVKENGQVVLIDFGIARVFPKLSSNHDSRQIEQEISSYVGTLPYMSPEQLSSRKAIDYRTDIYSLGVTLYEMLLGERAFKGTSLSMYRAIQNWYPPEPSSIHKDIPPELDIITMKAMEKDKHRRYRSGAEFAEDLHRWLHGMPILSSRISWWARMWRKFRGWFRWI